MKEQVRERDGGILNEDQARLGNRRWNRYGAGITQTFWDREAGLDDHCPPGSKAGPHPGPGVKKCTSPGPASSESGA